jgi:dihydroorotase
MTGEPLRGSPVFFSSLLYSKWYIPAGCFGTQQRPLTRKKAMQVILDKDGGFLSATFRRPSNFHAHLRRDALMRAIAKHIMRYVLYLLIMPNTGPIRTMEDAIKYYGELMRLARRGGFHELKLIMTLYHTSDLTTKTIEKMARSTIVRAVKHYPPAPGATTGSGVAGAMELEDSDDLFWAMADNNIPLLGHFEAVVDKYNTPLDPRDGEATMVKEKLWRLRDRHPKLRICFEHMSTAAGVEWVEADTSGYTACTITPHHPNFNENDFPELGPDLKCKPIVNRPADQEAVARIMVSGDRRAIAGDDTAAHPSKTKHVGFEKAANGCYLAEQSIPLHARAFIRAGAMDQRFENFMSLNGPAWWGLPPPDENDTVTLERSDDDMPDPVIVPEIDDVVVPLGWKSNPADRLRIGLAMKN